VSIAQLCLDEWKYEQNKYSIRIYLDNDIQPTHVVVKEGILGAGQWEI